MNNRKIKKNRGGKRLGWRKLVLKGWGKDAPPLTLELLEEYLMNLFVDRHDTQKNN